MRTGRHGRDVELVVPVGTEVWIEDKGLKLLGDLMTAGHRALLLKGGRGGRGNAHYTSATNRFPVLAEAGESGATVRVRLEMKLVGEVGIVGAPNAGKSSLLRCVSAARPRVASYPFTTTEPMIGMVEHRGLRFAMVEIPGLIEGAHEGLGLGFQFLKHVQRTRVLVHVVDASVEGAGAAYQAVRREMELFDKTFARRPEVVALNKIDVPGVAAALSGLQLSMERYGVAVYPVSALSGEGIDALMDEVTQMVQETRQQASAGVASEGEEEQVPMVRPRSLRRAARVEKRGGVFVVDAPAAERIVAMIDLDDWTARSQFNAELRRMGVTKALDRAGAQSGDRVRLGDAEWELE